MKQKKNLRQIFSVFLTCMMILGVALANDHIFVEGEGKPQEEQQVQEGEPQQEKEQEQEQGDPGKPGEQKPEQGEIQEGKPQQEPEQGQEPGQQEQGQGDSGKPGELPEKPEEVNQRGGQELTDITISELEFLYNGTDMAKKMDDQDELTMCGYWNTYRFNMEWDATSYKNGLKSGDYFIAKLPTQLNFLPPGSPETVEIKDQSGNTVAEGKIFELKGEKRFAVKATFTDKVEGISLVKGEFHADVKFAYRNIDPHGEKPSILEVKIGNNFISRKIWIGNKPYAQEKHFEKWGSAVTGNPVQVQWTIRLNHKKNKYVDWKLEDIILPYHDTTLANSQYIPDSFIIKEVELNEWGEVTGVKQTFEYKDIKDCFIFDDSNTKFTFTFKENIFGGPINGRQYVIYYKTDYIPGKTLTNSLEIFGYKDVQGTKEKLTDETKKKPSFISNETGGSVEGDLKGQIKIIKVDGWDTTIKLKGAEFTIKKAGKNNPVIEAKTTDVNGEAIFEKLAPGKYTIEETVAPQHYTIEGSGTHSVDLKTGESTQINIGNAPKTIKITVEKKWLDEYGKPISAPVEKINFKLYDENEIPVEDEQKELNKDNNWKNIFDVREYAKGKNGNKIEYTVKEVDAKGNPIEKNGKIQLAGEWYTVTYDGSMEKGFVITNKKTSNTGGGGSGGGQSGGGSGGTGGDDSNKPKPNDPKPNNPKPNNPTQNGPTPSDDSTGMGGATPPDSSVMPDGSVVPNDSTTATNTVAPKNQKMPKNPVLTDKQGVKKTAQAGRRLPKTGEGANPTLYAWMLGALGSMLVLVGYRKRKTVK